MKQLFSEGTYDAVVIGAGHAGCEAALALARTGLNTVILTSLQHIPSLSTLTTTHSTLTKITNLYQQLLKTTNPINTIINQIQTTTHQIDALTKFTSIHFTTCPLCNQPFNPNIHITH